MTRDAGRPTAFVGDSHLLGDDGSLGPFVDFVGTAPGRFDRLVLVGDIFDLWLARPHLHEPHHDAALAALEDAAAAGLCIDYVVGNRDYGVEGLRRSPFARVGSEELAEPGGSPTWLAAHGDLVNARDRQYRAWRSLSRSAPVLGTFLRLPAAVGVPASQWLERRMRTTNLDMKRRFPTDEVEAHAAQRFDATGARFLVLGHFHVEKRLSAAGGEVLVVADWKRTHRHAEWHATADGRGRMDFVDSF